MVRLEVGDVVVKLQDFLALVFLVFLHSVFHFLECIFLLVVKFSELSIFFDESLMTCQDVSYFSELFRLESDLFKKLLVFFDSSHLPLNSLSLLLKNLQQLLLSLNIFILFHEQLLLIFDNVISFGLLFLVLLQEYGELDHTFLNFKILLPELPLLITELKFGLLAVLFLVFVFLLLFIHLPSLFEESCGWCNCFELIAFVRCVCRFHFLLSFCIYNFEL